MPVRLNAWRIIRPDPMHEPGSIWQRNPYLFDPAFDLVAATDFVETTGLDEINMPL
jgi:hypothetical protein